MTPPIRGITLTHPWPFAIARMGKDVENRQWRPERQGGCIGMYLAIHGGVIPKSGEKLRDAMSDITALERIWPAAQLRLNCAEREWLADEWLPEGQEQPMASDLFLPGIVALARVARVSQNATSPWAARGQWHWELTDVTPIKPIQYRGAQGLWTIDDHTVRTLQDRWAQAHDGQLVFA